MIGKHEGDHSAGEYGEPAKCETEADTAIKACVEAVYGHAHHDRGDEAREMIEASLRALVDSARAERDAAWESWYTSDSEWEIGKRVGGILDAARMAGAVAALQKAGFSKEDPYTYRLEGCSWSIDLRALLARPAAENDGANEALLELGAKYRAGIESGSITPTAKSRAERAREMHGRLALCGTNNVAAHAYALAEILVDIQDQIAVLRSWQSQHRCRDSRMDKIGGGT